MSIWTPGVSIYWIRYWIRNSEPLKDSDSGFESLKNRIFEKLTHRKKVSPYFINYVFFQTEDFRIFNMFWFSNMFISYSYSTFIFRLVCTNFTCSNAESSEHFGKPGRHDPFIWVEGLLWGQPWHGHPVINDRVVVASRTTTSPSPSAPLRGHVTEVACGVVAKTESTLG